MRKKRRSQDKQYEAAVKAAKKRAFERAEAKGDDYVVYQSTKKPTLFFPAHKDTKLKDAVIVTKDP